MLTHDLILDAAERLIRDRVPVGTTAVQRKVRVGFATAGQLLFALEDIGILSAEDPRSRRRTVLAATFDRAAVVTVVDAAVAEGRMKLDCCPSSNRQEADQ